MASLKRQRSSLLGEMIHLCNAIMKPSYIWYYSRWTLTEALKWNISHNISFLFINITFPICPGGGEFFMQSAGILNAFLLLGSLLGKTFLWLPVVSSLCFAGNFLPAEEVNQLFSLSAAILYLPLSSGEGSGHPVKTPFDEALYSGRLVKITQRARIYPGAGRRRMSLSGQSLRAIARTHGVQSDLDL